MFKFKAETDLGKLKNLKQNTNRKPGASSLGSKPEEVCCEKSARTWKGMSN